MCWHCAQHFIYMILHKIYQKKFYGRGRVILSLETLKLEFMGLNYLLKLQNAIHGTSIART